MVKLIRFNVVLLVCLILVSITNAQSTFHGTVKDRNNKPVAMAEIKVIPSDVKSTTDSLGNFEILVSAGDSIQISKDEYQTKTFSVEASTEFIIEKKFQWHDLINPQFYIEYGGLWLLLFVIFAETGLFAGFFLPGDSLLFVAGIYSRDLASQVIPFSNEYVDLIILWIIISIAGILGNFVGYWFGRKSGPFLYERKDTFFFKKKYLIRATDFYNQYGGWAIVAARFVPIIRTFAPIVAGVVKMDKKKFTYFNIIGCAAWVLVMLFAGHFLYKWVLNNFNVDLKEHLEMIVIIIVAVSTIPIIYKFFFAKDKNDTEKIV